MNFHDAKSDLTVKEASILIGRHVSNIYRWIAQGDLPHSYSPNDGRTVTVNKDDLLIAEAANLRHGAPRKRQP